MTIAVGQRRGRVTIFADAETIAGAVVLSGIAASLISSGFVIDRYADERRVIAAGPELRREHRTDIQRPFIPGILRMVFEQILFSYTNAWCSVCSAFCSF